MDVIEMLRDDTNYYGDFGKQYLSNSDIGTLLKDTRIHLFTLFKIKFYKTI